MQGIIASSLLVQAAIGSFGHCFEYMNRNKGLVPSGPTTYSGTEIHHVSTMLSTQLKSKETMIYQLRKQITSIFHCQGINLNDNLLRVLYRADPTANYLPLM